MLYNNEGEVKIADFGCAKLLNRVTSVEYPSEDAAEASADTGVGTVQWCAPEILKNNVSPHYRDRADIWSLGMTCIEMSTGAPAWKSPSHAIYRLCCTTDRPLLPEFLSGDAKNFLCRCFERNASERPDAKAAMEDAFLRQPLLHADNLDLFRSRFERCESNVSAGEQAYETDGDDMDALFERSGTSG